MDENSLRKLGTPNLLIDFSSNDYLGFSFNKSIFQNTSKILKRHNLEVNGATGSRLLSGNHSIYTETEQLLSKFYNSEHALLFNSGYDANVGFFSSVPQRGDVILYDELCHASIRDGIKMSDAKAFKFNHNNLIHLEKQLSFRAETRKENEEQYIVTESVFSMDGDQPDLISLVSLCKNYNAHLIIDEAHAVGIFGDKGEGLVKGLGLENEVFARIITFGKALGCHGAAILCSAGLKNYLVNFSRSFIYTTALPPHSIATIQSAHEELRIINRSRINLKSNIAILLKEVMSKDLEQHFILSDSAIHSCVIPGNTQVKKISEALKEEDFDVKPILSPTVPRGQERLRICIHSFNTSEQIKTLISTIATFVK
ncbi:aminotransferase class I/II-fold pyridoxal phosphate-dependent enzyme [Patiriisocius marinus]|nr:pyridoxal phosphate-dependent aminotransferase family protein [Patiriisocius marinus]